MIPGAPGPVIAAVGSPPGTSSRGLVRSSGEGLHAALAGITSGPAHSMLAGRRRGIATGRIRVRLTERLIDLPALFLSMPGPSSFTGEDCVEIQLAGNPDLLHAVETAVIDAASAIDSAARPAGPGEFTARAFMAGRIGLLEAEGVAATIAARNDHELDAARHLCDSPLAGHSRRLTTELTDVLGLVEAGIDFTDEESVQALSTAGIRSRLTSVRSELARLRLRSGGAESAEGRPRVAIVGPPNAGKSTLFNALLGHDRSVVTDIAGTTRDSPAEACDLPHRTITLVDTAGLGESEDELAERARESTVRAIRQADLILLCIPLDNPTTFCLPEGIGGRTLPVATRCDLGGNPPTDQIAVSSLERTGLEALKSAIEAELDQIGSARIDAELVLLPRHTNALSSAEDALGIALDTLRPDPPGTPPRQPEVLAEHIRAALDAVASLDGGLDPEEVLGVVFSNFCVGK